MGRLCTGHGQRPSGLRLGRSGSGLRQRIHNRTKYEVMKLTRITEPYLELGGCALTSTMAGSSVKYST